MLIFSLTLMLGWPKVGGGKKYWSCKVRLMLIFSLTLMLGWPKVGGGKKYWSC
jgi:hypothetical protein